MNRSAVRRGGLCDEDEPKDFPGSFDADLLKSATGGGSSEVSYPFSSPLPPSSASLA